MHVAWWCFRPVVVVATAALEACYSVSKWGIFKWFQILYCFCWDSLYFELNLKHRCEIAENLQFKNLGEVTHWGCKVEGELIGRFRHSHRNHSNVPSINSLGMKSLSHVAPFLPRCAFIRNASSDEVVFTVYWSACVALNSSWWAGGLYEKPVEQNSKYVQ